MVDTLKLTYERVPLRRRAPYQTNYEVVIVKQATKRLICAALCFAMLAGFFPLAAAETGYDRGFDGGMAGTGNIYAHGLDVSAWQESGLNFQNFANAGYDFVILHCGTSKRKDACFEEY